MALDIDERHLLRLGHGEEALETEKDFSRSEKVFIFYLHGLFKSLFFAFIDLKVQVSFCHHLTSCGMSLSLPALLFSYLNLLE